MGWILIHLCHCHTARALRAGSFPKCTAQNTKLLRSCTFNEHRGEFSFFNLFFLPLLALVDSNK